MSCAKSCLFCLANVDPATCSEVVTKNPKNVEIQPLLHYLTGVDPSSDGASPGSRIPVITQLPPLCLPCYEKLGQLHQLHRNLLEIQRLIQGLTLEMRKSVRECRSKSTKVEYRSRRKSKLDPCQRTYTFTFQDDLGAGIGSGSQKDFNDLQDLIIGSNDDVIFPSKWTPLSYSGASATTTAETEGDPLMTFSCQAGTSMEVDNNESDTDVKPDDLIKEEHSSSSGDGDDHDAVEEKYFDFVDEGSDESDLSDNDDSDVEWELDSTGKMKRCSKKETEPKKLKSGILTRPKKVTPTEFPCRFCDKTYETKSGRAGHYRKYHPDRYATGEIPKRVTNKPDNVAAQRCPMCGRDKVNCWVEVSKMGLHMESHLGNGRQGWKCEVCSKVYPTRSMILHHLRRSPDCSKSRSNDAVKMHVCKWCPGDEKFNFEMDLFNHVSEVHEKDESLEKLHKCTRCESEFRTNLGLDFHMNTHVKCGGWTRRFKNGRVPCPKDEEDVLQNCKLCNKMIPCVTGQEMKIHLTTEHKVKQFVKCKLCSNSDEFIDHEEYLSHLQSEHNEKDVMKPCHLCESEVCDRISQLRKHYFHIHQLGLQYVCDHCSGILYTEESLKDHIRKHHSETNGKFACEFCLKSGDTKQAYLSTKRLFEKHLAIMHPVDRFKCERPQCTAQFRCKADFMEHEKSDHQNDPLACPVNPTGCKEFLHALSLKAHVVQVHNRKPAVNSPMFKCSSCDKAFKSPCHLKLHEKIHSEEKPFQCDQCPKAFKSEQHFKSHQLTHLPGGKPRSFVCEVCSRAFFDTKSLKQHSIIHTDERPFPCQLCGKTFRQNSTLHNHMKGHKKK